MGIIRVTMSDGTGRATGITDDIMAKTAAHELYGHALLQAQGKSWKHDDGGPVDNYIGGIEANHAEPTSRTMGQLSK